MIIDFDVETIQKDFTELLENTTITGHINHREPKKRKRVVSKIGKDCAKKISEAMIAYLTAWKIKS